MVGKKFFITILGVLLSIFAYAEDDFDIDGVFLEQEENVAVVDKRDESQFDILDKVNYLLIVIFLGAAGAVLIAGGEVYREIYDEYVEHEIEQKKESIAHMNIKLKIVQEKLSFVESGNKYVPEDVFFEKLETLERLSKEKEGIEVLLKKYGG